MTNNEELFEQVLEASMETDEPIWQLPIFDRDKERVRNSKFADLNNSPGREGHAVMAGTFLGEFAEDTPWVHLDIAGTSETKGARLRPSWSNWCNGTYTCNTCGAFWRRIRV